MSPNKNSHQKQLLFWTSTFPSLKYEDDDDDDDDDDATSSSDGDDNDDDNDDLFVKLKLFF